MTLITNFQRFFSYLTNDRFIYFLKHKVIAHHFWNLITQKVLKIGKCVLCRSFKIRRDFSVTHSNYTVYHAMALQRILLVLFFNDRVLKVHFSQLISNGLLGYDPLDDPTTSCCGLDLIDGYTETTGLHCPNRKIPLIR